MPDSQSSSGQSTEEEYFLPTELVLHNKPDDCWVSCLGGVYDLTEYVTKNADSPISKYLVAHGGKDVSHWFESSVRSGCGCEARLRRFVSPATGLREILLPFNTPKPESTKWSSMVPESKGRCCDCGCAELTGKCWAELEHIFNGEQYRLGSLTKNSRPCWITNVLTGQRAFISVCEEDSIRRIKERALIFNRHLGSYTCKFEGKLLDVSLSLTENGITDERDRYLIAGLPDDSTDSYVPNLLCYFNDDLTEL
ncbi:hypothetical protein QAD02_011893 [Eretmocerus hayati]|uniref:Uncharacterized protein n=1 Tax=Eretmocerus hayati TaxID=131215 RepID=A0ACC2P0Y3_9HYME|nr:hypothetical protein QAD02_011893 [Eretmocerus hayati]